MKISEMDPNFKANSVQDVTYQGVKYQMIDVSDLTLEGFAWEHENEQSFYRMPERILPNVSEPIQIMSSYSTGGVLRFCTDSKNLLLRGNFRPFEIMPHMPLSGQAGFDVVIRENGYDRLLINFQTSAAKVHADEFDFSHPCLLEEGMHEYRVYFPLYAGVKDMQIGISEGAHIEPAPPHKIEKPILYYGSSITQGGCSSRTSSCYTAMLASWVDAEQINLGFSGNARGETIIAETIAELDLSCFVMDYDHNAFSPEHLKETHEPFFKIIREKHPELPVIFVTRPLGNSRDLDDAKARWEVVRETYQRALDRGDKNVYFVDGLSFYDGFLREVPTVDRTHPTDLGFYLMAKGILPTLERALGLV